MASSKPSESRNTWRAVSATQRVSPQWRHAPSAAWLRPQPPAAPPPRQPAAAAPTAPACSPPPPARPAPPCEPGAAGEPARRCGCCYVARAPARPRRSPSARGSAPAGQDWPGPGAVREVRQKSGEVSSRGHAPAAPRCRPPTCSPAKGELSGVPSHVEQLPHQRETEDAQLRLVSARGSAPQRAARESGPRPLGPGQHSGGEHRQPRRRAAQRPPARTSKPRTRAPILIIRTHSCSFPDGGR